MNPFLGIHQVELSVIGLGPDRDAAGIFYSRLTGFSLFGSYDNHAVRRLGAIDCRSRRIPQDIDCLDIRRVEPGNLVSNDIGQVVCHQCARIYSKRIRLDYTVHHPQRSGIPENGGRTSDLDIRRSSHS